jgi:hypothetical protein
MVYRLSTFIRAWIVMAGTSWTVPRQPDNSDPASRRALSSLGPEDTNITSLIMVPFPAEVNRPGDSPVLPPVIEQSAPIQGIETAVGLSGVTKLPVFCEVGKGSIAAWRVQNLC